MPNYHQTLPQQSQHLPFFFGHSSNPQYMPTMVLPPSHASASNPVLPMGDMEALPSASVQNRGEEHPLNIPQMEMMEDGVMSIHQDIPNATNLLGPIPEEALPPRPNAYDYASELHNNYSTVTRDSDTVSYIRFRHNNCATWTYRLSEKQEVKIRIALQENQLFFNLEDILSGVCGVDLAPSKIVSETRSLAFVGATGRCKG